MAQTPVISTSVFSTITVAAQQFALTMGTNEYWELTASVPCYIAQSANPTAAGANGSELVLAAGVKLIEGASGAKISIIRVGAVDGVATMTRINFPR